MSSSNPYDSPQPTGVEAQIGVPPIDTQGDATGGIIPYKNPAALAAYYLAIVGLFPNRRVLKTHWERLDKSDTMWLKTAPPPKKIAFLLTD